MSKKIDKVLRWTKNITDWHEETFFSKELPMKMDYHNNQVGRMIFQTNPLFTEAQFVEILLNLTIDARQIQKESNLSDLKHQLVYITDDTKE